MRLRLSFHTVVAAVLATAALVAAASAAPAPGSAPPAGPVPLAALPFAASDLKFVALGTALAALLGVLVALMCRPAQERFRTADRAAERIDAGAETGAQRAGASAIGQH